MLIAVTNRHLCSGDFLTQIEAVARGGPHAILLREKDLPEDDYIKLARSCAEICDGWGVELIVHTFAHAAVDLGVSYLHISMDAISMDAFHLLRGPEGLRYGVSVHSLREAVAAQDYHASYVVAGHIFATASKKNAAPRGLAFLKDMCTAVTVPVFAIGGITPQNVPLVMKQGAQGVCVMSSLMKAEHPEALVADYKRSLLHPHDKIANDGQDGKDDNRR